MSERDVVVRRMHVRCQMSCHDVKASEIYMLERRAGVLVRGVVIHRARDGCEMSRSVLFESKHVTEV